ncbi:DUF2842 domain-containing protein [Devosia sp.]|uniref:DUF2842 domain-containing protein n=1 Tax=Devosia sp. TaxID=1871048 RepID=UPI003A95612F
MTLRTRKLLGTMMIPASLVIYSALAVWVYLSFLEGAVWWVLIGFFAIAGMGWFFPAAWIISWMSRPEDQ